MKFNNYEQETVIIFDAKNKEWNFYTCVPSHIELFTSNSQDEPSEVTILTEEEGIATSIKFTLPKYSINLESFIKKQ
ncbi:hypothetical protein O0Q50_30620 [Priestia aryabhattai]|uniref:Uncharacterized protein n=1 Tax=Priestia aryabhattai TaxID=412384 RepID=A0AAX6NIB4_PRIAR|nr:hypothetical protein [Priestia aryabhattai]MDU9695559.1 hypothetical protein [Priestia aryabhattai]